jgi:glycosyltransferase involved in cell wall biosynthesis
MKPKLLVLQGVRNFEIPTYVESESVRKFFRVSKATEIIGNPDLVYCQAYGPVYKHLMACKTKLVMHTGGSPWLEMAGKRLRMAEEIMHKATKVVCNSKFLYSVFKKNMKTDNIDFLPGGLWGLDHTPIGPMPTRFKPKESYQMKDRPVVAMSFNLMNNSVKRNKWAGIEIFLQAVEKVAKKWKVLFMCSGRGERNFPYLWKWKKYGFYFNSSHHLDDATDRWPEVLNSSDMFVHPSTFDCWPRVVADAVLTGLPGMVFDTTGNPEVCDRYYLVKSDDPKDISEKFESMLFSPILRYEMGQEALMEAKYKTERHREDYANLLLKIVKGS